jgi:hypothetical protein
MTNLAPIPLVEKPGRVKVLDGSFRGYFDLSVPTPAMSPFSAAGRSDFIQRKYRFQAGDERQVHAAMILETGENRTGGSLRRTANHSCSRRSGSRNTEGLLWGFRRRHATTGYTVFYILNRCARSSGSQLCRAVLGKHGWRFTPSSIDRIAALGLRRHRNPCMIFFGVAEPALVLETGNLVFWIRRIF